MATPRVSPVLPTTPGGVARRGAAEADTQSDIQSDTQGVTAAAVPRPGLHVVRYRGFVLIPEPDLTWLIRPERSPMRVLPFRAPASSLTDIKALVDWRLRHLHVS